MTEEEKANPYCSVRVNPGIHLRAKKAVLDLPEVKNIMDLTEKAIDEFLIKRNK